VLDGFYLQLVQEKDAPSSRRVKSQAYLETETGQVFPLDANILLARQTDGMRP